MDKEKNNAVITISKKQLISAAIILVVIIGAIILATGGVNASNAKNRGIGLEKSVAVALADAGYKQEQVTDLKGSFDHDDGVEVYDVYFVAGGYEYEYTIKAADGTILDSEIETPDGKHVTPEQVAQAGDIGLDKAKSIALKHAGVKASAVEFTKTKKDFDDNLMVYELEFYRKASSEVTEYEYDINAATGEVIKFSKETKKTSSPANSGTSGNNGSSSSGNTSGGNSGSSGNSSSQPSSSYIGVDKAKSIALKNAGVSASAATFTKAKLDRDDGIYQYEIEFFAGGIEYEYDIDALNGKILDWESERMDDDDWDDDWDDDDWDDDDHDHDWDD